MRIRALPPERSSQGELERAELLYGGRQFIAGLEPHLFLLGIARDHPFGGAGIDDVARLQRHQSRGVADKLNTIKS